MDQEQQQEFECPGCGGIYDNVDGAHGKLGVCSYCHSAAKVSVDIERARIVGIIEGFREAAVPGGFDRPVYDRVLEAIRRPEGRLQAHTYSTALPQGQIVQHVRWRQGESPDHAPECGDIGPCAEHCPKMAWVRGTAPDLLAGHEDGL